MAVIFRPVRSVLLIDALLESVLHADLPAEHEVRIAINGQTLFKTDPERPTTNQMWANQRLFKLYDLNWQLEILPKTEFVLEAYSRFSSAMLALLVLLSSLASLTVYSLLTSRGQPKQAATPPAVLTGCSRTRRVWHIGVKTANTGQWNLSATVARHFAATNGRSWEHCDGDD